MMQYPQITIPPRSEHLWRYTPWKRIHPTKVEEMPEADPIKFSQGEEFEMADMKRLPGHLFTQFHQFAGRLSSVTSQSNLTYAVPVTSVLVSCLLNPRVTVPL